MKLDDILALEDDDSIQYVSPTTSGSLTVKAGSTNTSATVMGVLPAYAKIVNQGVQSGRYIIDADVDNRSAVCVIGPDLAEDLFGNTNVVGNTRTSTAASSRSSVCWKAKARRWAAVRMIR